MSIKVLPTHVSDQIAAGEVVERPASVVKELVENSLDAGASHIEIRVEAGGKKQIQITDNGKGMSPEDAEKCVLRHATSKIANIDDLFSIQSFGFRGEALAAISAVSRFELITKKASDTVGTKITLQAGQNQTKETVSANTGTTITISDLFYSTPVRLEYLKTDETEYRQIFREVVYFALSNPNVSFQLFKNETLSQDLPSANNLKSRISQLLPKYSEHLLPLEIQSNDSKITGFVCSPGTCHNTKNHQYMFVNGRHINDYKLNYAIREAYVQSCGIEKHLHPMFVVFIETDPILVDVNVHPRKLEIKFSEPADMFQLLKRGVVSALDQKKNFVSRHSTPEISTHFSQKTFRKKISQGNTFSQKLFSPTKSFSDLYKQREIRGGVHDISKQKDELDNIENLTALAQIARKYILAESENGIFLFDQHALHERERFETFWNEYKSKDIQIQKLLTPQVFDLTEDEISTLNEHQRELQDMGFSITFPSDTSIKITAVPSLLSGQDLEKIMLECLQYFENHAVGENAQDMLMRKLLEYKSCRGAIMYGDKISLPEAQKLLDDFLTTKWATLCPHGRPNHTFWSFEELDRKFHR